MRTSLPLDVDGKTVEGAIYQAVEEPGYFYVAEGDAMLRLGTPWPYSPRVGGLSMHAPKSRNFIVCLRFQRGGVPFRSSASVIRGVVRWKGSSDRLPLGAAPARGSFAWRLAQARRPSPCPSA